MEPLELALFVVGVALILALFGVLIGLIFWERIPLPLDSGQGIMLEPGPAGENPFADFDPSPPIAVPPAQRPGKRSRRNRRRH